MNIATNNWKSLIGTLVLHAVVLLALLFYYITPTQLQLSEELEGVPVMFGNIADAGGELAPWGTADNTNEFESSDSYPNESEDSYTAPIEKVRTEKIVASNSTTITQNREKTITVEEEERLKEQAEQERQQRVEEERKKREAQEKAKEEARKAEEVKRRTAGLFGKGTAEGNSRGNTQGEGTQGSPEGNSDTGKTSGVGGRGTYDLGGRGLGAGGLVTPSYNVDDYGTVVVDIVVNPQGKVVSANIGRGTNTPSTSLQKEALKAARQTRFAKVEGTANQKGTITYTFNLR